MNIQDLARETVAAVKEYFSASFQAFEAKLGELEGKVGGIATIKGEQGEKGEQGPFGESAYEIAKAQGFDGTEEQWLLSLHGKAGEPGRDAIQIEILPTIDPERSYARGTYASHRGGVVRAARTTDYLSTAKDGETVETKGWQIVLCGIAEQSIEAKGERGFVIRSVDTAGRIVEKTVEMPVMIYRGVWREGQYGKGDTVTWAGSLFHCEEPTAEKPGTGKGWKLAVKRGADGKDLKHVDR